VRCELRGTGFFDLDAAGVDLLRKPDPPNWVLEMYTMSTGTR
jgi:hypothetical protein